MRWAGENVSPEKGMFSPKMGRAELVWEGLSPERGVFSPKKEILVRDRRF